MSRKTLASAVAAAGLALALVGVNSTPAIAATSVHSSSHTTVLAAGQILSGKGGSGSGGGGGSSNKGSTGGGSTNKGTTNKAPTGAAKAPTGAAKAPTGAATGRNVQAPSGSSGQANNSSNGRQVKAPARSTGKAVPLTSSKVIIHPPSKPISIPSTARASGKTYTNGTTKWTYSQASYTSYYSTYHGGYPDLLTSAVLYYTLFDSPYYYPNYAYVGNPWYGHSIPAGFYVYQGQLYPVSSGSSVWGTIFTIIGIIVLVGLIAWLIVWWLGRRRNRPTTPDYGADI